MAQREIIVELRLDNQQSVRALGSMKIELKQTQAELNRTVAAAAKVGDTSLATARKVGELDAKAKNLSSQIRELGNDLSGATAAGLRFRDKMADAARAGLGAFGLNILGVTAAITSAVRVFQSSLNTIKNFEQANANLASILGKTRAEITALTESAIKLGPALGRAPEEVSNLQTELAKLGFTEDQILQAQEAVIQLANATGEDLATSATVAAGTLKAFGLEASDTQRLVDVMAQSFNATSLDLTKFENAMSTVAPVARAAGVSLEETTAVIGLLSDANIDASTIGTALRDIFIDLAAKGITLEDALAKINGSQDKLTTATDLFGKRSATVALVMAENTDKAEEYTEALNNAGGAAKKMADEQLNTLAGALQRLSGTWDAAIISGRGFAGVLKNVVDVLSDIVGGLAGQRADKAFQAVEERTEQFANTVNEKLKIIDPSLGVSLIADQVRKKLESASAVVESAVNRDIANEERLALQREKFAQRALDARKAVDVASTMDNKRSLAIAEAQLAMFDDLVAKRKEVDKATKDGAATTGGATVITEGNTEGIEKNTKALDDNLAALIKQNEERLKLLSQPTPTEAQPSLDLGLSDPFANFQRPDAGEDQSALTEEFVANMAARAEASTSEADAFVAAQEAKIISLQNFATILDAFGDLAAQDAVAQKALSTTAALINTYLGVTQVLANKTTLPEPAASIQKGIAVAAVLATGLAAVKRIQGFAEGGYTEQGPKNKPVGIVHGGEWVAPKRMVEDERFAPIIDFLERQRQGMRLGGRRFESGGSVGGTLTFAKGRGIAAPPSDQLIRVQHLAETRAQELQPVLVLEHLNTVAQRAADLVRISEG